MVTKYEYNSVVDTGEYIFNDIENAQTFTVGNVGSNENFDLSSIKMKMSKIDGNPGTITFYIRAVDGSGFPTGSNLSSGSTDGDTLPTYPTSELREISMSSYELQASTQYAIIISYSAGDNYLTSDMGDNYGGGTLLAYFEEWVDLEFDTNFELWGTATGPGATGTNQFINVGDNAREISEVWVNIGDNARKVNEAWMNVGDNMRKLF